MSLSSISGAGGPEQLRQLLAQSGVDAEAIKEKLAEAGVDPAQFGGRAGGAREAAGEKLTAALEAQGLDADTIEAIKAEIQAAVESSDGARGELKETIGGILESHGVDTEALRESFGPPEGGRPGGAGGGFGGGGLLSALQGYESNSGSSDPTQTLLQALFATDEQA